MRLFVCVPLYIAAQLPKISSSMPDLVESFVNMDNTYALISLFRVLDTLYGHQWVQVWSLCNKCKW